MEIRVRLAKQDDMASVYRWTNDPVSLRMNLKQGTLPIDVFARLFTALLHDEDTLFLIAEARCGAAWLPVAQVRLSSDGNISMAIDKDYRGRRLAAPIILAAIEFTKDAFTLDTITARIWRENTPSVKAFERAGFRFKGEVSHQGHPCVEYDYKIKRELDGHAQTIPVSKG